MNDQQVTFVLNTFRRQEALESQVRAVLNQTVAPTRILVWQNGTQVLIPDWIRDTAVVGTCNSNLGVWARFAYALNAESEFVCVLDDDTIPGPRWTENCLETIQHNEGLLGCRGMRFRSRTSYHFADEVGWRNPNETVQRVDIVGHAWFFRYEWLRAFWSVPPVLRESATTGEDIHFSFALQQQLGLPTFVPPHPAAHPDLWGSIPEHGEVLGNTDIAVSTQPGAMDRFQQVYRAYVEAGFELCSEGRLLDDVLGLGANVVRGERFNALERHMPLFGKIRSRIRQAAESSTQQGERNA